MQKNVEFVATRAGKSAPRQSGIELLRILCIFAVIANHYSVLGPSGIHEAGWRSLSPSLVFLQAFGMFGKTACSVFILATGYFAGGSIRPGHAKRIAPIVATSVFWAVSLYFLIPVLSGYETSSYGPHAWLHALVPFWNGGIWFVTAYVVHWLALPFVNPMLGTLSRRQFHGLFAFFALFWCLPETFFPASLRFDYSFGSLDYFFFFHAIGVYLRRFRPHGGYSNRWNFGVALVAFFAMAASPLALDCAGVLLQSDAPVRHALHFCVQGSIPSVALAVSSFCFFQRIRLQSPFVNWVARSVLGIYLIHALCQPPFLWFHLSPPPESGASIAHAVLKCCAVFLVCLFLDKLVNAAFGKPARRAFNRLFPPSMHQSERLARPQDGSGRQVRSVLHG